MAQTPTDRLQAVAAHLKARRFGEALALSQVLLREGVEHPLPLGVLARALRQAGRLDEAIAVSRRWTVAAPGEVSALAHLARCRTDARRVEEALVSWDEALALAPNDPNLLSAKAGILQELARTDEARALFARAAAAAPGHLQAGIGLAMIALETGDLDAAQTQAERLTARWGAGPAAAWLAARVAVARRDFAAAQGLLAPLAADAALPPGLRADALLLLGDALDGLGRPHDAFAAAVEGKALQRALHAERARGREGEVDKLTRLKTWFAAADPAPWRTAPPAGASPVRTHVFLVGFPRSGTTLLEQLLAGHPDITALEEGPTLAEPYADYMSTPEGLARLAALPEAEANTARDRYWETVRDLAGEPGAVFLDKAPAGTLYLPLIARLFPDARILFAIRDPRDVVLSCLRNNFQMNAMTYAFTALDQTAACYDACMGLAEVYRALLPLAWRDARHEALVADVDAELAGIAAFLDLDVTPGMTDIAATAARRTVRTPSAGQVRAGLNASGVARWRAYEAELAPIMPVLAPWIERFKY
ncbi:MAG: sulfotransferase family protein [Caulobacter sp.]|nr:sulfotransferase family protein [Caulobacter sp.]